MGIIPTPAQVREEQRRMEERRQAALRAHVVETLDGIRTTLLCLPGGRGAVNCGIPPKMRPGTESYVAVVKELEGAGWNVTYLPSPHYALHKLRIEAREAH